MDENKKHVALVRCEFGGEKRLHTSYDIDCNDIQLLIFVGKTLELAAKLLNEEPDKVAKKSIAFYNLAVDIKDDESENGEES